MTQHLTVGQEVEAGCGCILDLGFLSSDFSFDFQLFSDHFANSLHLDLQ